MAKPKKPRRMRKPTAPKVSRSMRSVRPMRGEPAIARRYDPGFPPPRGKSPWQDEGQGEPEVNG
jgi:hypothetical protein